MQKLKLLYFFAAVCVIAFSSCNDDDDDVSPNVSLLTNGEWAGNAVYYNGQDITDEFEEDYELDFSLYTSKFERDGTYQDHYNDTLLVEGTWEYENNERVILFDKDTRTEYRVVISKLDENELYYIQGNAELRFTKKK